MHTDIIKQIMITSYWRNCHTSVYSNYRTKYARIVRHCILCDFVAHDLVIQDPVTHDSVVHDLVTHDFVMHDHVAHDLVTYDLVVHDIVKRDLVTRVFFLYTQCIEELLAFVNSRAEYRSCQACIWQLHTQCLQQLLAFVNSRAEYGDCQAFVYRNYILSVYRNCWHL